MNIFKSFCFSLAKKRSRSRPKKSAPAPAQILNRLRLQPKNLGSDRLRLRNTGYYCHPLTLEEPGSLLGTTGISDVGVHHKYYY